MTTRRILAGIISAAAAILIVAPVGLWSAMALWFRLPAPDAVRMVAAGIAAIAAVATMIALFSRFRWRALAAFALAFACVLVWWSTILPPADGDWAPDVARQTTGAGQGRYPDALRPARLRLAQRRRLHRAMGDAQLRPLASSNSLDLILAYWAGPQMAHLIMSFGFDGRAGAGLVDRGPAREDRRIFRRSPTRSSRIRSSISPPPSATRSACAPTSATRTSASIACAPRPRRSERCSSAMWTKPTELQAQPAWYNSITTNCTTAVSRMIRSLGGALPFDWRLIVNGYLPGYLYDHGAVSDRHSARRAHAAGAHQRARPGRRPVAGLLAPHPGRRSGAGRQAGSSASPPGTIRSPPIARPPSPG